MNNFQPGKFVNQGTYKSFQPELINRSWQLKNMELLNLLSQADRQMGRLDMYSEYIPNLDLFISMHVVKEANQSSKIEGTQTNIEEVLLEKEDVSKEKRDDWEEVQNYISALNHAIESLESLPFSSRLIKNAHRTLLQGVRGKRKLPGEFRTSQNWIGGTRPGNAAFVPPPPHRLANLLSDFEEFLHKPSGDLPPLVRIGLLHVQFETIHPYLDGNGRIGRLLVMLALEDCGLLSSPLLYLIFSFHQLRAQYYFRLGPVRTQ